MTGAAGWTLHTLAGGGFLLLLTAIVMTTIRQPAWRQRLGEWGLAAALLLAAVSLAPAWLVIAVAVPAPTATTGSVVEASPDTQVAADPARADVWLVNGVARLAPPLGEPAAPSIHAEVPPSSTVNWGRLSERLSELLLIAYFAGAAGLLGHWLLGCLALGRLLCRAEPAPVSVVGVCREVVGRQPLPRLLVSSLIAAPFSCGVRCPTIVLPTRLVAQGCPDELRWVLVHEWTHLERGDARGGWLFGLGRAVFYPLPWFWWMRRQVRLSQEYVADAAASAVGRPEEYAQFLLNWVGASAVPAAASGVIGRSSDLLRRITMLLQDNIPIERRCARRWSVLTACGLFALGAIGGGVGLRAVAAPAADQQEVKKEEPAKDVKKGDAKPDANKDTVKDKRPAQPRFNLPEGVPPELAELFKGFEFDPANPEAMQQRMARLRERMQRTMERRGSERFTDVRPSQPRLGVKIEQPSPAIADQLDLPLDQGLVCTEVMPDSAAAKAGLKPHDILLEMAGKPVLRNVEEFLKMLADCKPNIPVDVVVLRKGKKETLKGLKMPEIKEQRVERPALPRVNSALRNLPFEARANSGVAGQKPAATTVVRNNDEFTAKHRDGQCTITITGKMADGKATVTGIDLTEAGQKHHWDGMDKVPAAHREKVQKLFDLAQQGEVKE